MRDFLRLNPEAHSLVDWEMIARVDPLQYPMPPETQYWSRQAVRLRQRDWTPLRRASRARFLWQLHRELWAGQAAITDPAHGSRNRPEPAVRAADTGR